MLRRLCLALLALCLIIPALSAPAQAHCAPTAMVAMHGHHHHAPAPSPASHECIGCAMPVAEAPSTGAPLLIGAIARDGRARVLARRALTGPDSPPPRA